MKNTKSLDPYWITTPEDLAAIEAGLVRGQVHHLCKSAGGRDIPYVTYGEKPDYNRKANYSSACGAKDPAHYADRAGKRTTIMLIGATHGQETEGSAALQTSFPCLKRAKISAGKPCR